MNKIYSKVDEIPNTRADRKVTKGCIVLEGGAFRGLYTAGVLDALMLNGINMECTVGVSAGALSGANYVSGQVGRVGRCNLRYRHDSRYMGRKGRRKSHGVIGFDFVFHDFHKIEPMDQEGLWNPEKRFIVVATDCNTGEPVYWDRDQVGDLNTAIQASASMPILSRMVLVDGVPCLDGGCSVNIPYQWALDQGYDKIIIVRTREFGFRKPEKTELQRLQSIMYRKFPELSQKLKEHNIRYNKELDAIDELKEKNRLYVIDPSQKVTVGRLEKDMEKLGELYHLGVQDTLAQITEIKNYLTI